jgi:hypothetical protein
MTIKVCTGDIIDCQAKTLTTVHGLGDWQALDTPNGTRPGSSWRMTREPVYNFVS